MSVPDWSDPGAPGERWDGLKRDLHAIAAHASDAGLEYLLVENLVAVREPSTMAQIEDLLTDGDAEHVPWRLCLDVGHQCVPGTAGAERDPVRVAAALRQPARRGAAAAVGRSRRPSLGVHRRAQRDRPHRARASVLETLEAAGAETVDLIFEIIPGLEDPRRSGARRSRASVDLWRGAIDARGTGA